MTNTELQELTGYKLASKQSSWLRARGYYVETNARGIPRVTYTQVEEMRRNNTSFNAALISVSPRHYGVTQNTLFPARFTVEPNLNGLRQKINKTSPHG
ncbi:MAG: DUF4224 domain-containing protein [Methylotenera sp.]|nr:DUF4224 domain-containing protein [Methylotenera sp.]